MNVIIGSFTLVNVLRTDFSKSVLRRLHYKEKKKKKKKVDPTRLVRDHIFQHLRARMPEPLKTDAILVTTAYALPADRKKQSPSLRPSSRTCRSASPNTRERVDIANERGLPRARVGKSKKRSLSEKARNGHFARE